MNPENDVQRGPDPHTPTRLLVRVLQDVIRDGQKFENYADLSEALKTRCAQLHIHYDTELVTAAIDRVEHGGRLRIVDGPALVRHLQEPKTRESPDEVTISASDAIQMLKRVAAQAAIKPMPAVRPITEEDAASILRRRHDADRAKALSMLLDEIQEVAERCDALEVKVK